MQRPFIVKHNLAMSPLSRFLNTLVIDSAYIFAVAKRSTWPVVIAAPLNYDYQALMLWADVSATPGLPLRIHINNLAVVIHAGCPNPGFLFSPVLPIIFQLAHSSLGP
jgi:hypothetical protein